MGTPSLFPSDKLDRERIYKVYSAMKQRTKARKWKSGKREGKVRVPEIELPFTKEQLYAHALRQVGTGGLCPYCRMVGNAGFITLATCVFDHIVSRKRGGSWTLANLNAVCADCNNCKGEMSLDTFVTLMTEMKTLPIDDQSYLIKCLRTQGHVMTSFRGGKASAKTAPTALPEQMDAFDEPF